LQFSIQINNSIDACKEAWDGLLPPQHHLQSRHLSAFEAANVPDVTCCYLQVFIKKKLAGVIYLQQFNFKHKHLNFNSQQKLWPQLLKLVLPSQLPILICGHLFRINFQGYYFEDVANNYLVFAAIQQYAKDNKIRPCGTLVKDCSVMFDAPHYNSQKYSFFDGDVTMEESRKANWNSFDDYINQLHKKYRQRAKKILAAFEGIEDRVLDADAIMLNKDSIERLYWNVVSRQTVKLGAINAAYFTTLQQSLGSNFEFHALYKDDVMVGFYTFIFYANEMETHFIGMDYEINKTHKLYFNILFLAIRQMIKGKYEKCELGRTAREAKANAGAQARQVVNYINVKNFFARLTLTYFLKRFNKSENYSALERSPFK
jgi:hypothetical protein